MYIAQAYKGLHEWWRYLIGFFLIFIVGWQLLGAIPITVVSFLRAGNLAAFEEAGASNFASLYPAKSNLYLFLILSTFFAGLIVLYLTVRFLHKRSFTSLTTSRKKIDWSRFFFGFGLITITTVVLTGIDYYSNPQDYVFQFEVVPFLVMAAISILFIPLQTSFEEYMFRGYLMQGIGILIKNKWFPLIITSVFFGGLHYFNPEVDKLGPLAMVFYIGTGLFWGVTTLMDEGMELSLGLHAGNNIIAALLVTTDWTVFQTHSILLDTSEPSGGVEILVPVLVIYPIFLIILARKYKWNNWREKLLGKVEKPVEVIPEEMV
jgi:membrane protease YdiL (CAAX protease family)